MNNMWGSVAQYNEIYWPWPIALYLFLAGLSAGAMMVAIFLRARSPLSKISAGFKTDACFKAAAILAPVTICAGLALLVLDLGKPLSFYWILLKYNFTSVMSIGVALLLVYTPLAFIYLLVAFAPQILRGEGAFKILAPLGGVAKFLLGSAAVKVIEILLFVLAVGVGVYTGFLLSAIQKIALWNNLALPFLFLVSGFSSGVASSVLCGMFFFKKDVDPTVVAKLLRFDLIAICAEILLLIALFTLTGGSQTGARVVSEALGGGALAAMFWLGVVGLGLALPIIIDLTALRNHAFKPAAIIFNAFIVIVGVVLLRYYIVYAGQLIGA